MDCVRPQAAGFSSPHIAAEEPGPRVLVFTRAILPRSETFIEDHVHSLTRYRPCLTGFTTDPNGLTVTGCDTRTLSTAASAVERLKLAFSPWEGALDRLARQVKPALVHAHFIVNALTLLPFLKRANLPLVVTAHGHDIAADPRHMRPADRLLYATRLTALGQYASRIICVSEAIREMAVARGLPPEKCVVQHLGIPLHRFARRAADPVRGRVLFVGRLVEKKGVTHLLDAVARVQARGIAVDVRIIGDGPERAALESRNRELGTQARFLGAQPRSRVEAELSMAWLFAMPSHRAANGDSEGLPIVYLEAQAAGVPVVAFDNGPAREAVIDDVTGLLAPELDVAALADNIARLLIDADLRTRLSAAAIAHVHRDFDLQRRTAELETLYDAVVLQHQDARAATVETRGQEWGMAA